MIYGLFFTREKFINFEILNIRGQSGTLSEYWDKFMSVRKVHSPVNLYLGVIVALICAVMVALNVSVGAYALAAILMVVLLTLLADLYALMRARRLPVRVEMVLVLVGIAILVAICQFGAEAAFYAFPVVVGAFLVRQGCFPLVFSSAFLVAVVPVIGLCAADWQIAIRLGLALLLCLGFLWFAAQRIAEAQSRLETSVIQDPLTGCFNRRHLARLSEAEDLSAASLILFDLDYFKSVNDTFGHPTGDFVLRAVTTLVRQQLDKGDLLFRIGGEEFLVLRLKPEEGTTRALAEQCRQRLEASRILATRRITATFSCADFAARSQVEPVLSQADAGLLQAKRAGRNRVV